MTYAYKVKGADDNTYAADVPTNAGEYTVRAAIAETADYGAGEALANFTIGKANVTGSPAYTAISAVGKTLADADIKAGSLSPAGELKWVDTNGNEINDLTTVAVEQGKAYGWKYTPTDAANYNVKTGTLIPWAAPAPRPAPMPSSGGSGAAQPFSQSLTSAAPSSFDGGKVNISPASAGFGTTVTLTVTPDEGMRLAKLTVDRVGGAPVSLTAYNIGGNNFFGLRELAAHLGYQVSYDEETNTAAIESR